MRYYCFANCLNATVKLTFMFFLLFFWVKCFHSWNTQLSLPFYFDFRTDVHFTLWINIYVCVLKASNNEHNPLTRWANNCHTHSSTKIVFSEIAEILHLLEHLLLTVIILQCVKWTQKKHKVSLNLNKAKHFPPTSRQSSSGVVMLILPKTPVPWLKVPANIIIDLKHKGLVPYIQLAPEAGPHFL